MMNIFKKLFKKEGADRRRSRRDALHLDVMYVSHTKEIKSGKAKVLNVNKGGVCLELDSVIEPNSIISIKINPHTVFQYIDFGRVMKDDRGRYILKVVWVREKDDGDSSYAGGIFLENDNKPYKG